MDKQGIRQNFKTVVQNLNNIRMHLSPRTTIDARNMSCCPLGALFVFGTKDIDDHKLYEVIWYLRSIENTQTDPFSWFSFISGFDSDSDNNTYDDNLMFLVGREWRRLYDELG